MLIIWYVQSRLVLSRLKEHIFALHIFGNKGFNVAFKWYSMLIIWYVQSNQGSIPAKRTYMYLHYIYLVTNASMLILNGIPCLFYGMFNLVMFNPG